MPEDGAKSSTKTEESQRREHFPQGMRVLAVDEDIVCLKLLECLLKECGYNVTTTQHACKALELLRGNKGNYDLVISDVLMPDMDGFKLLEIIGLEMDLPIIMLSVDKTVSTVMNCMVHGACDYLVKPVRLEELKVIWKHVVGKSLHHTKGTKDPSDKHNHENVTEDNHTSEAKNKRKAHRREKEDEVEENLNGELTAQKRQRVSWTPDLHFRFTNAVDLLGIDRAVPKGILDLMNVPGLTRGNIASHLQKYRKAIKKKFTGMKQQRQACPGSNGVLPSSNQQIHANVDSFKRHRVGGYQNSCLMVPFNSSQSSQYGVSLSTSACLSFPFHPQDASHQQLTSTPQIGQSRMLYHGHTSNPSIKETLNPQPVSNDLGYQSLTSRPNQFNSCMGSSSQHTWAIGNVGPNSVAPPQSSSNQHPTLILNTRLQCDDLSSISLSSVFPVQQEENNSIACAGVDLDIRMQINKDSLDIQSCEGGQSKGISHSELTEHLSESSPKETMFYLNAIDDNLHSVLKQVRQNCE